MAEPTRIHRSDPEPQTLTAIPDGDGLTHNANSTTAPSGYVLDSLIGEGGMGVVYRARELAMSRDVAVKILRSRFSPDSAIGRRFVEEARITGQLQHPGIPPVHQVGMLPDGRPFLAMKLIKGRTLDQLLKEGSDPGIDRGRNLAIFEQVAQAVGYAHAHSVIHRDLKPANVMVGGFGEVQVMDWGLAKVLGDGQPSEPMVEDETSGTEIRSLRDGAEATQAGSLLGTPAFMPPEQAIGAVDQVTERSDVFGLGAILCVMLTGSPPFVSESAESTRRMAARARLDEAFARLDVCGAEPELIALAKHCLAPEPCDRPADAGKVASAVAAFRADAERRAREAEMDRARAEVRSTEERKRRRMQVALVMAVLTLFAGAGFAAWGIESVRADRRADQLRHESESKTREAELLARHLLTERDVIAALNETQVLREEGWKQVEDLPRWKLTLAVAHSSLKRAEALLESGEPTDELRTRVASVRTELARDDRDQVLLAELDRLAEENDVRFLMPVVITGRQAERYASVFRTHGVDLVAMPTADAVAWLKGHRFRDSLTTAVRNWEGARPLSDMPGVNFMLAEQVRISGAVAGEAAIHGLLTRPSIRERLNAILKAVTDDPFAREWWDAVARHDVATLKKLLTRAEFARLSSRELSSLTDGLFGLSEVLSELLPVAYERFPGEFWVNFRLGTQGMMGPSKKSEGEKHVESIRYLTAAVAARPRSAMARVALGMTLLEKRKDDPMGRRMLQGATVVDPASPWPHLFLGLAALEAGNRPDAFRAFEQGVRAEPDVGFFMIYSLTQMMGVRGGVADQNVLPPSDLARLFEDLIAACPEHAGGYVLRGEFRFKHGDYRLALADYQKAQTFGSPGATLRLLIFIHLPTLEKLAPWEVKLPAILRGELRPANGTEFAELAEYCVGFERKYVLATRFAADALAADPKLYGDWAKTTQFAGWAIQAATGKGVDAMNLSGEERSRLRRNAHAWLQEGRSRVKKEYFQFLAHQSWINPDLAPVRDPGELAKLPPDERATWSRFWGELPKLGQREVAPPPRAMK